MRRVVTGMTPAGKSVFVSDGEVQPITLSMVPGSENYQIWGADEAVQLPTDGSAPTAQGYFPIEGGFRFGLVTLPPAGAGLRLEAFGPGSELPADFDAAVAIAEANQKLPGLMDVFETDDPSMHRTDTVDCIVVISGEVSLELDDSQTVHLNAGDCVVQNGTRHAWRNTSGAPCMLAFTIVGAHRR